MTMPGYIDVTELDARALIRAAYAASAPFGFGILHAIGAELDDETLDITLSHMREVESGAFTLEYVHGRNVKLYVSQHNGRRYVNLDWPDHGADAMVRMLGWLGLPDLDARVAKAQAELDEAAIADAVQS